MDFQALRMSVYPTPITSVQTLQFVQNHVLNPKLVTCAMDCQTLLNASLSYTHNFCPTLAIRHLRKASLSQFIPVLSTPKLLYKPCNLLRDMFRTLVTCDELVEKGAIASPCWVDIGGKEAQPD